MLKGIGLIATALLMCAILAPAVWADSLAGQSGTVSLDSPTLGAVAGGPYSFTVPSAGGVTVGAPAGRVEITISGESSGGEIDLTFPTFLNATCSTCTFIGEALNFPGFTISGVSASESFGAVVTFDANDIYVNFLNYEVSPSDYIDISVSGTVTPLPTPEPSPVAQLVFGLLAIGVVGVSGRSLTVRNSPLA